MAESRSTARGSAWKGRANGGTTAGRKPGSKKRQIFWVTAAILALVGAIAAFFAFIRVPPETRFLPVVITEINDPHLPTNAFAEQDRNSLADLLGAQEMTRLRLGREQMYQNAFASQEKDALVRQLKELHQDKPKDTRVVYLSAPALTDEKGKVCLLPADAKPDVRGSWLPLADVLKDVQDCPAQHKLVILDIMRAPIDPRLGILSHDVAEGVKAAVNEVPDDHRLVLCACSPGQVALVSEDLGQSVFGYYVDKGLRGWADACGGNRDSRVSAVELYKFVQERVDHWAYQNRGLRQTPMLLGPEPPTDFELVVLPRTGAAPDPDLQDVPQYPSWLRDGWAKRERWWNEGTYRVAPLAFRRLELALLRAEQQWRGGVKEDKAKVDLAGQMTDLDTKVADALKQVNDARPRRPLSIAQAVPPAAPSPERRQLRDDLKRLLEAQDDLGSNPKPDEATKFEADVKAFLDGSTRKAPPADPKAKAPEKEKPPVPLKDRPLDLAWAVFDLAVEETAPRDRRIHFFNDLLARAGQRRPEYVETLFLKRLDDLAQECKAAGVPWPTAAVRSALRAVSLGERAAACDPRVFPWVRDALESAAQKRHDAEVLLFNRRYTQGNDPGPLFDQAVKLYEALLEDIRTTENAYLAYDQVMVLLPDYLPYLLAQPDTDLGKQEQETWTGCCKAVQEVEPILAHPPASGAGNEEKRRADIDKLGTYADQLQRFRDQMLRPFTTELEANLGPARKLDTALAANYMKANILLEVPWLSAKDREEVWRVSRSLAHRLDEATRNSDTQNDTNHVASSGTLTPVPDAVRAERHRAAWRADLVLGLLRVGGLSAAGQLTRDWEQAKSNSKPEVAWPEFSAKLRKAWTTDLANQIKGADPAARDRLSRIYPPLDDLPPLARVTVNPTAEQVKDRTVALRTWLGGRYIYESQELASLDDRSEQDREQKTPAQIFYRDRLRDLQPEVSDPPVSVTRRSPDAVDPKKTTEDVLDLRLASNVSLTNLNRFDAVADPAWLKVTVPSPGELKAPNPGEYELHVGVELQPGADYANSDPPRGFLLGVVVNGRTYHFREPARLPEPKGKRLQLLVTNSTKDTEHPINALELRPNAGRQSVYLFVKNPTKEVRKGLVVELKAGSVQTRSDPFEVPAGTAAQPVVFKGTLPKDELPELKGALEMSLLDAAGNRLDQQVVDVSILSPSEYIKADVSYDPKADPKKGKLTAKVSATRPLATPCHVKLVIPVERINGLIPRGPDDKDRGGMFEGDVAEGKPAELFAEDFQFGNRDPDEEYGFVYLTVDGYERALIYKVPFPSQGTQPKAGILYTRPPELRVTSADVARTGAQYRVRLQIDNAPPNVQIEVGLDRSGSGNFQTEKLRSGDREVHKGFSPFGPDGALAFETSVHDWIIPINTAGIVGESALRVRLFTKMGDQLKPVLGKDNEEVVFKKNLLVDESRPTDVEFEPIQPPKEGELRVVAKGTARSGIDHVEFFLGEPAKDKQQPDKLKVPGGVTTKPGKALNDDKTRWEGNLVVPDGTKGPLTVSVRFVSRAGTDAFETKTINLGGGPAKPGKPTADIKVTLKYGMFLADGEVVLKDKMGKETVMKAVPGKGKGEYLFKDVKPGEYKIVATVTKSTEKLEGKADITVVAGEDQNVPITVNQ